VAAMAGKEDGRVSIKEASHGIQHGSRVEEMV
jgi:hypothetical protein